RRGMMHAICTQMRPTTIPPAIVTALALFALTGPANAQEPLEPAPAPPPAAAAPAQAAPKVSIALERVAGFSYTKLSSKDNDDGASLTTFALGSVTANPYVAPRLGIDVILEPGVTVGAGLSIARFALSDTLTTTTTTVNPGGGTSTTSTTK